MRTSRRRIAHKGMNDQEAEIETRKIGHMRFPMTALYPLFWFLSYDGVDSGEKKLGAVSDYWERIGGYVQRHAQLAISEG